jgi:hypothetical protein
MKYLVGRAGLAVLALIGAGVTLTACAEIVQPRSTLAPSPAPRNVSATSLMARFVSLGTSNSQGVQSAGINEAGQHAAWPAQLARRAGVTYDVPLIQNPGCNPPLLPLLVVNLVLVAAFGDDLVNAIMTTCSPLQNGVKLPASNLAISGANAHDALNSSIESEARVSARKADLYRRVLLPGQTQVTAMLAKQPTFVSVELAANEVLPASTGRIAAMTPFSEWQPVYDAILNAVKSTGAGAVLVGLPNDAANFPSIRRARDFFTQWPLLLGLGISVSDSCASSSNYLFIPGYLLTLLSELPTTATCADVPGVADYVLTPSDISAINSLMSQMNAHIRARASENGWAYFSLSALYDLPKPAFKMTDLLFSLTPFGPNISLDGVHPSAQGQAILATAAAQAINAKYGVAIP